MTEAGDKPAPTAEVEVLEDTDQPTEDSPPCTEPPKETQSPKSEESNKAESRPAPTKTGKMVVCRVIMLDAEAYDIEVDKGAEGRVLFDKVCKTIKLREIEYFGLTYIGARDVKFWLNLDKRINKQLKGDRWVFEFAVKFYPPEPSFLLHDYTKYLLCLQIRIDVFNGRLPCSIVTHAILGAYTVQADIGDYEPPTEGRSEIDYLRDFDFAPHPSEELYHRIHDLHKTFKGMEDIDAEELYLENAKKLAMYGVDLHKAKDSQNVNIFLGVCASGVMVYRDKLRINRFVWPKILKLSYKRSNFYVKLRPTEGDTQENTICFKLENHKMAKLLWKTCVEHHAFFRLKEAEPPRKGTLFPRFNSRFRYSGRTQKQIQDGANTLDKQKEPFERKHPKRTDGHYIDRNSDHPLDEKDRLDRMNRDPATISSVGPPPYSKDDDRLNQTAPGESRADKPGHLPGEAEDRLDKERDETATLERRPEEQGTADIDVGPGITPVGRKSKRSKEEKEREKREKEEEKKRKKEEERKRKQQEKENKKKKDLDKSTTEDRTDKMGPDDSTLTAGDPGAAELQHGVEIKVAVASPEGAGSPEKDNETDKDKETDGEKEPSSPTTKDEKGKSKKDKKKDKKGDKHKEEKDKKGDKHDKDKKGDKHDKDKDDKKGSRKGLFGSGRKPKRSDSKSKQSDSEPSSPVSPGFDATAYPSTPPGGNLEHQETQGHTEITVTEDESGQDQEIVNDLDNSKIVGRKKEVKFIDECKIPNDSPVTMTENTNGEQVNEETVPLVAALVNTKPENHKIPDRQTKENSKQTEKIEATPIIKGVSDVKEETKADKPSEQIIPDENIEDEVFEPEAENMEKVQENNVNTTKELEEKTVVTEGQGDSKEEIGACSSPQTEEDTQVQVEGKTSEEEIVNGSTEKEKVVAGRETPDEINKGNVQIELVNVNKTDDKVDIVEVVENTDDKILNNEVKEETKENDDEQQKEDVSSDVNVDENNTKDLVEVKIDEVEHKEEVEQVIINPDDVTEESVNKGELILPIKVTTEEAGNNHESKEAEVTGAVGGKEENQVSEKEKKQKEKEEKQKEKEEKKKEKEEKKKEKERLKKEEKERKRLEKEQKKKEIEEKKKLEKEKKENEKQKKKSKKSSSSVSPAVEEVKDEECQGQEKTEEAPPSPAVDPVQVELAVALQQRKKHGEEEEVEGTGKQPDSEQVSEPMESPENEPQPSKSQENVNQSESNDQKMKDVAAQNSDKPSESPEEGKPSEPNEKGINEITEGCEEQEAKTVKPKKSKKEKNQKPKKEKKEKKKKKDTTGCFAFMKKPQKSESDEDTVPVEDMPTEPWNTETQEQQEPKEEEVMEEKVAPKQRGVGLGWALPAFEEMKERQAAAAAAREAKAGLDNEGVRYGDWPVDREGSIDRKMQFIAVTPPSTETKEINGVPENEGMAFFEPPGGGDVNGEPVKVKKVPPPVPPKGVRGSSDLDNMSEEDRLRYMGGDGLPPTVATESMKYAPDTDETPIATTNFPTVKTETRTVTYEKDGIPVAIEDGILISSQSHSTRTQTIETTTYKTERDGMMETRMEKKVIISEDNNDIDHDQLLADAIRAVTEMDQNMSVEKIECTRQIES